MSDYSHLVIAFDCDGVIFDYCRGFMEWAEKHKGVRLGCAPHEVSSWTMANAFPDLDEDQIWDNIVEFSAHEDFGKLVSFEGAFDTICALHAAYPGVSIQAITSAGAPGTSEITKALRLANLAALPFDKVTVLELGASKSDELAKLPLGTAYIDDLKKHVDAAEAVGMSGILYRQSYNKADTHARVAVDWKELDAHIREIVEATPLPVPAAPQARAMSL